MLNFDFKSAKELRILLRLKVPSLIYYMIFLVSMKLTISFFFLKLTISFLLIAVDKENVKPPVIEGLDTLVAVSSAFLFLSHVVLNY